MEKFHEICYKGILSQINKIFKLSADFFCNQYFDLVKSMLLSVRQPFKHVCHICESRHYGMNDVLSVKNLIIFFINFFFFLLDFRFFFFKFNFFNDFFF